MDKIRKIPEIARGSLKVPFQILSTFFCSEILVRSPPQKNEKMTGSQKNAGLDLGDFDPPPSYRYFRGILNKS